MKKMNMYDHRAYTKNEFRACEWTDELGRFKDEAQKDICEKVLDLLDALHKDPCCARSIPYAIRLFSKLASCEMLVPLTGEGWEWRDVGDGVYQNIRCSHVFKQAGLFDGQAYDARAVVFYDWIEHFSGTDKEGNPDIRRYKSQYTSADSLRLITFPYTPTTVYVETPKPSKSWNLDSEHRQELQTTG